MRLFSFFFLLPLLKIRNIFVCVIYSNDSSSDTRHILRLTNIMSLKIHAKLETERSEALPNCLLRVAKYCKACGKEKKNGFESNFAPENEKIITR